MDWHKIDEEYQESPTFLNESFGLKDHKPLPKLPKQFHDENIELLRQEQEQGPLIDDPITSITNIRAYLYANTGFNKGNIKFTEYRQLGSQIEQEFNFQLREHNYLFGNNPQHYKLWDLVKTISAINGFNLHRAYIYKPNNNEEWTSEYSLFFIVNQYNIPDWAVIVAEDWIIPLRGKLEANWAMTAVWRDRQTIEEYYQTHIGLI